jgi:rubrerythrin
MDKTVTAEDILAMAQQVEADAAEFYAQAAEATSSPRAKALLQRLAAFENDHEHVFSGMSDHIHEHPETVISTDEENTPRLTRHLASGVGEHLEDLFEPDMSAKDILQKAIEFEKDTIVFFTGLRALLKDPEDQQRIDAVIREELGHVLQLTSELATGQKARRRTNGES